MSLWCECKECGGTDEFIMCENKLLDAWVEAYKPKPFIPAVKCLSLKTKKLNIERKASFLTMIIVFLSFISF